MLLGSDVYKKRKFVMKRRGTPDGRGMGAQSDFISTQFTPGDQYKKQQLTRAKALVAAGISPKEAARMLSVPLELLLLETTE
jgi:hypothetical protein